MAIDPPYRLDPFQNIINISWEPPSSSILPWYILTYEYWELAQFGAPHSRWYPPHWQPAWVYTFYDTPPTGTVPWATVHINFFQYQEWYAAGHTYIDHNLCPELTPFEGDAPPSDPALLWSSPIVEVEWTMTV